MKNPFRTSHSKSGKEFRPDYYLSPTRDFTQYTKDCEEKYWSKETAFDWSQDVESNLRDYLEDLDSDGFSKIGFMALPLIEQTLSQKIAEIRQDSLSVEEDALNFLAGCLPFDKGTIQEALQILSPLRRNTLALSKLEDQLEILQSELADLQEQQRLGLFREGIEVKQLSTEAERQEQALKLSQQTSQIKRVQEEYNQLKTRSEVDAKKLKEKVRVELTSLEPRILKDLEDTQQLVRQALQSGNLSDNPQNLARLKDLILKRQLLGLKDIANHALVVEQSAIAPLTMGIIHYKRHREIQEALTTFVNDEAKHSATFRRFLAEKLDAKEYISAKLIKGASRYMWLARFMPGTGLFMAVLVEAIGASVLEFFAKKEYMPDSLFRSICTTISEQDEKRHMDLCVAMYNELFRKGHRWERIRNKAVLKIAMKAVYGDKSEDNRLIQAFGAFGVESEVLYKHVCKRLSQQLARISLYVEPEEILTLINRK
jgi:hypothetical protein